MTDRRESGKTSSLSGKAVMTEPGIAEGGGVGLVVRNNGWTRDWSVVAMLCPCMAENLGGLNGEETPISEYTDLKCDCDDWVGEVGGDEGGVIDVSGMLGLSEVAASMTVSLVCESTVDVSQLSNPSDCLLKSGGCSSRETRLECEVERRKRYRDRELCERAGGKVANLPEPFKLGDTESAVAGRVVGGGCGTSMKSPDEVCSIGTWSLPLRVAPGPISACSNDPSLDWGNLSQA